MKNYYEILGIQKNATQDEIKRAYFKKVRMYSPEKDPENFKLIREAYDVLANENSRKDYDKTFYRSEINDKIEEAVKLIEEEKFEKAILILQNLLEQEIRYYDCYGLLSFCYIKINSLEKAIEILEEGLEDEGLNIVEKVNLAFLAIKTFIAYRMIHKDERVVDFLYEVYYDAEDYVNSQIMSFLENAKEENDIRSAYYCIWLYNYLSEGDENFGLDVDIDDIWEYVSILEDLDSLYNDKEIDIVFKHLLIYLHEYIYIAKEQEKREMFNNIIIGLYNTDDVEIKRNIEVLKNCYNEVYKKYEKDLNEILMTIRKTKEKQEKEKEVNSESQQSNKLKDQQTQAQNKNEEGCGGCLFLLVLLILLLFHC